MSVQLLDKTRKINKLLHNNNSSKVVFNDICKILTGILDSNVFVFSKKGKILGRASRDESIEIGEYLSGEVGEFIEPVLNERFLEILSTKENVNLQTLGFVSEGIKHYSVIISPIDIAGERLGTLFSYRLKEAYDIEDIILSEYATTVIGLEMMRSVIEENQAESRKYQVVQTALSAMSLSELTAIASIFDELSGNEGVLVASKIADNAGITRSVIVNALRKLESAAIIDSRSSGMRGTYIKIINSVFLEELEKIRKQNGI